MRSPWFATFMMCYWKLTFFRRPSFSWLASSAQYALQAVGFYTATAVIVIVLLSREQDDRIAPRKSCVATCDPVVSVP